MLSVFKIQWDSKHLKFQVGFPLPAIFFHYLVFCVYLNIGSMQLEGLRVWRSAAAVSRLLQMALLAVLFLIQQTVSGATTIQTVSGMLHAENFTYYKLNGDGWLRLELHSLQGDVDLYVSGLTLHPSFSEYELKSETCGVDSVDIHSSMNRPVGIAIYAHPSYVQSSYRMDILVVSEHEVDDYEQLFRALHYYDGGQDQSTEDDKGRGGERKPGKSYVRREEEEESIWWTILVTILKFILEVIV